jgi:hypothetical protein
MFSMNLPNWRRDPFVEAAYAPERLEKLAVELGRLTAFADRGTDRLEDAPDHPTAGRNVVPLAACRFSWSPDHAVWRECFARAIDTAAAELSQLGFSNRNQAILGSLIRDCSEKGTWLAAIQNKGFAESKFYR